MVYAVGSCWEKSLQILMKQELLKGAKACKIDFLQALCSGKADVWGPSKIPLLEVKHYFITFVDDFSRRVWVYTMKTKDEVLEIFLNWKNMIENQTGRKIKQLNDRKYRSDLFSNVCNEHGIVRHFTVKNTP